MLILLSISVWKIPLIILSVFIGYVILELLIRFLLNPGSFNHKKDVYNPKDIVYQKRTGELFMYYNMSESNDEAQEKFGSEVRLSEPDFVNSVLKDTIDYIGKRYDCSDFDVPALIWIYREFYLEKQRLPDSSAEYIEDALLNFKYWIDQPNNDSMCYWSENHQILFAVSEYLAGMTWKDKSFSNDGKTGKEHMELAKVRINDWMELRFKYGFSEWYSANYYPEDIAPMAALVRFTDDDEMREKMKICIDLLLFDMMSQSFKQSLSTTSGRAYSDNKPGGKYNSLMLMYTFLFDLDDSWKTNGNKMIGLFIRLVKEGYYEIPKAIREIGLDTQTRIIKAANGLTLSDLHKENLIGKDNKQIMAQFGMEAFANPEVVKNTMLYFRKNKLFSNHFFAMMQVFDLSIFRIGNFLPWLVKKLNPMTNGIAIQRSNVYTYRTKDYLMSTAQSFLPGGYATQQHVFMVSLDRNLNFFHQHPARDDKRDRSTPGYWTGAGRLPMSVQHENINLSIYHIPKRRGFLEMYKPPQYTHAYIPRERYDEVILDGCYIFARKNDVYLAAIGSNDFSYADYCSSSAKALVKDKDEPLCDLFDIILPLKKEDNNKEFWITVISTKEAETSFANFQERIKGNNYSFDGNKLSYEDSGKRFEVEFAGEFRVDDESVPLIYSRFDSDYAKGEFKQERFEFTINGNAHEVVFENALRKSKDNKEIVKTS